MPANVCIVKVMVFPVIMYRCESWTIKKAVQKGQVTGVVEHRRTDAVELWCWRRLLRVPWTARRSSQSILKEINPEYSLEGLMLKLKLQYFGHLMRRANSLEKTLLLGQTEVRRRRGWQRMRWLDGITNFNGHELGQTPKDGERQRGLVCCGLQGRKESDMIWWLNNIEWTVRPVLIVTCFGQWDMRDHGICHFQEGALRASTQFAHDLRKAYMEVKPHQPRVTAERQSGVCIPWSHFVLSLLSVSRAPKWLTSTSARESIDESSYKSAFLCRVG